MPAMMNDAITRMVITGRRMQMADTETLLAARLRGLGRLVLCRFLGHRRAVHQAQMALDHDLLAGLQALADDRFAALRAADGDRTHLGDVVRPDHEDVWA